MSDDLGTADRIIDIVKDLMMSRGFNAISYADIANIIGIRKASIHYHFPTKADLGEAVITRYTDKMATVMAPIDTLKASDFVPAFDQFLVIFTTIASSKVKVCLGGVLGAEYETLPEGMRHQVRRFYSQCQGWLTALLEHGRKAGAFAFAGTADDAARVIFSAMEGAMIIGRALADPAQLEAATRQARAIVGIGGGAS